MDIQEFSQLNGKTIPIAQDICSKIKFERSPKFLIQGCNVKLEWSNPETELVINSNSEMLLSAPGVNMMLYYPQDINFLRIKLGFLLDVPKTPGDKIIQKLISDTPAGLGKLEILGITFTTEHLSKLVEHTRVRAT